MFKLALLKKGLGYYMKEQKLPRKLRKMLRDNGENDDTIRSITPTDMNREGLYQEGFLVLTKQYLYLFLTTALIDKVHYFKGYSSQTEMDVDAEPEWALKKYNIDEIERLWTEAQVACSILLARINDTEYCLAVFSNLHKKQVHQFVTVFEQVKNNVSELELEEKSEEEAYCKKCGRMYPDSSHKVCPKCMDKKSIFRRVLRYFLPYKLKLVFMFLCIILTASMNLVWPYLNGKILYDQILARNESFLVEWGIKEGGFITALLLVVLTMLATKLTLLLLQILQGIFTAQIVTNVVRDMKKDIFRTMGKLSISFYHSRQTGSLMTRVMSDADRITGFFFDGAPYILINGFIIIASVIVMFRINWYMTVVTILLFPVLTLISFYLRPKIWIMFGKRHRAERAINGVVNDNLAGTRVIKSFGQEKREIERFESYNERLKNAEVAIAYRQSFFQSIYGGAQEVATLAVWGIGTYFLLRGKNMNLGTLITFIGYVGQLSGPMSFFARIYNWWADSMNSAQRMFEIIDAVPDVKEAENPIPLKDPIGNIRLEHVTFGYECNRPVLKDINLDIPAGSMLGIVGRSGAGKTTIVNLISRMYDTQEGSIYLDGIDIKTLSFHDLRRNVAMVSQETYIFMGTVTENISYANKEADYMEILKAAKLAGAHEFIMRLPDGYDTKIGVSGRELSGGERQRISIARAILANPKLLILDEATASVDTETERVIQKAINYLVQGRTTISIAHRLSTLRDADYLVVIDNGEIIERGTHAELEALHGTYYKLMELQTKALAIESL